jgi:hypothetical protein
MHIKFLLTYDLGAPAHKVILENTFVQLVQNVGGATREDVVVQECCPEW